MWFVLQKKINIQGKAYSHKLINALKQSKREVYHHPFFFLLIVCLTWAIVYNNHSSTSGINCYQGTQVAMNNATLGQFQLIQMRQKGAKVCSYDIAQKQTINAKKPFRQTNVELYQVAGDMELMPVALTAGSWPESNETQCVIDEETSYTLFGDCDGVGNTIWFADKQYEVTGIADSQYAMVYLYNPDQKYAYDRILIQGGKEETKAALDLLPADQILSTVEYQQVNEAVSYLRSLPAWFAILFLWIIVIIRSRKNLPITGVTLLLTSLLLYLSNFYFYLPDIFIPERWSHLEFYPEAIENLMGAIQNYLIMVKGSFEGQYLISIVKTLFTTVVLILLQLIVMVRLCRLSADRKKS